MPLTNWTVLEVNSILFLKAWRQNNLNSPVATALFSAVLPLRCTQHLLNRVATAHWRILPSLTTSQQFDRAIERLTALPALPARACRSASHGRKTTRFRT